jgi:drug/metabolite transporter (DMT)-like permease
MTFRRLSIGHVVALLAALGLLLALAPDWYSDKVADQLRDTQGKIVPQIDRETTPSQSQLHAFAAEEREKNAWQATGQIDRFILVLLLMTAALAIASAFLRALGRRVGPPTLSGIASLTGLVACALIAYRIIQPPGFNDAAIVKWGAPLGLLCAGVVAIASRFAARAEREAGEEPEPEATPSPAGA